MISLIEKAAVNVNARYVQRNKWRPDDPVVRCFSASGMSENMTMALGRQYQCFNFPSCKIFMAVTALLITNRLLCRIYPLTLCS